MSPPSTSSSEKTSQTYSPVWDCSSSTETEDTSTTEGLTPPIIELNSPDENHHPATGLESPPDGGILNLEGFTIHAEAEAISVGDGVGEAQRRFVHDWVQGVGIFDPGPRTLEVQHVVTPLGIVRPFVPTDNQSAAPGVPTLGLALVSLAAPSHVSSSLEVESDNATRQPASPDTQIHANDTSNLAYENTKGALLGIGEGLRMDIDQSFQGYHCLSPAM